MGTSLRESGPLHNRGQCSTHQTGRMCRTVEGAVGVKLRGRARMSGSWRVPMGLFIGTPSLHHIGRLRVQRKKGRTLMIPGWTETERIWMRSLEGLSCGATPKVTMKASVRRRERYYYHPPPRFGGGEEGGRVTFVFHFSFFSVPQESKDRPNRHVLGTNIP